MGVFPTKTGTGIDITQARPPTYAGPEVLAAEKKAREGFEQANYAGVVGTVDAALQGTLPAAAFRFFERQDYNYDPAWSLNDQNFKGLTEGIDRDLWGVFGDAHSDTHAQVIRSQMLRIMEDRTRLAAAGTFGTVASVTASIADPAFLAAGLVSGGAAYGAKGAQLLRAGLITGATMGGLEAVRQGFEPTAFDARAVLQAAAGGGVLGGVSPALGGLGRTSRGLISGTLAGGTSVATDAAFAWATGRAPDGIWDNAAVQFGMTGFLSALHAKTPSRRAAGEAIHHASENAVRDGQYREVVASGAKLTPKGEAYFREQIDPTSRVEAVAAHIIEDIRQDATTLDTPGPLPINRITRLDSLKTLHSEQNPERAVRMLDPKGGGLGFNDDVWLSNNPDFATGQHGNTGVRIEFDARDLKGVVSMSKPGAEFQRALGNYELLGSDRAEAYQQAVKRVTIDPSMIEGSDRIFAERLATKFEREGWTRKQNDDGSVTYTRPTLSTMVDKTGATPDGTTFKTSRGSEYTTAGKGTKRFKVADGTAHDPSDSTVFVTEDVLSEIQSAGVTMEHSSVRMENGKLVVIRGTGPTKRVVYEAPYTTRPEIGLHPIETWNKKADGTVKWHLGNDITEVQFPAGGTSETMVSESIEAMGAASPGGLEQPVKKRAPKTADDFDFSDVQNAPPAMVKLKDLPFGVGSVFDAVGLGKATMSPGMSERLAAADNGPLNLAARIFGSDALGAADGSASIYSAPEKAHVVHAKRVGRQNAEFDTLYGQHKTEAKAAGRKPLTYEAWREEVTKAVRRPANTYTDDPTINRAADYQRHSEYRWGKEFAERHRVKDFDTFPTDSTYAPRIVNRAKLLEYAHPERYGSPSLVAQIQAAIMKGADKDGVPMTLDEAGVKADDWLRYANSDGQSPDARSSRRIPMDETHQWTTPDGVTHSIEDFLYNDAAVLGQLYLRHTIGAAAAQAGFDRMSTALRLPGEARGPEITSRGQLLEALRKDFHNNRDVGNPNFLTPAAFEKYLEFTDVLVRNVEGVALRDNLVAAKAARIVANVNVIRGLSNVTSGIMNLAELPGSLSALGWRTTLKRFPAVQEIMNLARTGKITNELVQDVQDMGIGTERDIRRVYRGIGGDEDAAARNIDNVEYLSARGARMATDASGISFGQDYMTSRMGAAVQQKFLNHALNSERIPADRLAAMGLVEGSPLLARIEQHIRDHAITESGHLGKSLVRSMTEEWDNPDGTHDVEAVSAYTGAIYKAAHQAVISPDVTGYALWMTQPAARLALQFRIVPFAALRTKAFYNLHMRDMAAAIECIVNTAAVGTLYTVQAYLRSLGREDAQEYRDKWLAPDMIAKAAFGRSAWASLVPAAIDTTMQDLLRRDPIFAHSRSSGLAGGFVTGNPTVDWSNSAARSTAIVQAPFFDDYTFSKQDLENIRRGWFIPNLYGMQQLFQRLGSDLPDRSASE